MLPIQQKERKTRFCIMPKCKGERFDLVHKFPMDNERAEQWRSIIDLPELYQYSIEQLRKRSFICSRHFRLQDYKNRESRSLNKTAMPSLNLSLEACTPEQKEIVTSSFQETRCPTIDLADEPSPQETKIQMPTLMHFTTKRRINMPASPCEEMFVLPSSCAYEEPSQIINTQLQQPIESPAKPTKYRLVNVKHDSKTVSLLKAENILHLPNQILLDIGEDGKKNEQIIAINEDNQSADNCRNDSVMPTNLPQEVSPSTTTISN